MLACQFTLWTDQFSDAKSAGAVSERISHADPHATNIWILSLCRTVLQNHWRKPAIGVIFSCDKNKHAHLWKNEQHLHIEISFHLSLRVKIQSYRSSFLIYDKRIRSYQIHSISQRGLYLPTNIVTQIFLTILIKSLNSKYFSSKIRLSS